MELFPSIFLDDVSCGSANGTSASFLGHPFSDLYDVTETSEPLNDPYDVTETSEAFNGPCFADVRATANMDPYDSSDDEELYYIQIPHICSNKSLAVRIFDADVLFSDAIYPRQRCWRKGLIHPVTNEELCEACMYTSEKELPSSGVPPGEEMGPLDGGIRWWMEAACGGPVTSLVAESSGQCETTKLQRTMMTSQLAGVSAAPTFGTGSSAAIDLKGLSQNILDNFRENSICSLRVKMH